MRPLGHVVTAPVCCVPAGPREGGPAEDEGAFVGEDIEKAMVCYVEDLVAVEVMHVIFLDAVDVCGVGGDGVHGEVVAFLHVVDYVWGVVDVTGSWGWAGP